MADIRIKDLATTASSTASDDFLAVDGSANGTRKLNAYSPTFGGNLTVSGTGTSGISGSLMVGSSGFTPGVPAIGIYRAASSVPVVYSALNNSYGWSWGLDASSNYIVTYNGGTGFGTTAFTLANTTGNATLSGNLTVSGTGTHNFSGTIDVNGPLYIGAGSILSLSRNNPTYNTIQRDTTNGGILLTANSNTLFFKDNGRLIIGSPSVDGGQTLQVSGTAAISGALSIGNTVQTAASVASTHKVTISIGGSTYYLLATNV